MLKVDTKKGKLFGICALVGEQCTTYIVNNVRWHRHGYVCIQYSFLSYVSAFFSVQG